MKPHPPDLPTEVTTKTIYDADLTDQVDFTPRRGQAWGVWLHGQRIGEVHLGRTKYRLQSIQGKPYRLAWMVNGERKSPEYDNRNAAVMGLLEIYRDGDPSRWHTPAVPRDHVNAGLCPTLNYTNDKHDSINNSNDDCDDKRINKRISNDRDDSHPFNDDEPVDENENIVAARAKNSPTQVKKYASCPRQWAWEYIEGIKPPQGPAAATGSRCHKVLENWLSQGISPDPASKEGKIVMPGLALLPSPNRALEVEREFLFEYAGHLYRGLQDLGYWGQIPGYDHIWVVHDHKTTSDFMWALTEEDLLEDVQAIIYALEAMLRHKVDAVLLSWLYMRTKRSPKAEPRRVIITRPEVESGMEVVKHYVDEMEALRRKHLPIVREKPHQPGEDSVVLTLEPNALACSAYGGCYFQDRCQLTKRQKMRSIMAQDKNKLSMKERMAARKAKRQAEGGGDAPSRSVSTAPSINPPETPPEEEETTETENKDKGNDTASNKDEAAANESTTTESGSTRRGRGRPKGSTAKKDEVPAAGASVSAFGHEAAFVGIYGPAIAGGDKRHLEMADDVWKRYKKEFMG